MIMISERPPEADDRAVPGHWEGDLILGSNCRSAIGTLVERASRFTMLVHLPGDHSAETVRDELVKVITTLPDALRCSLAWDQGTELARHKEITFATGIDIFFCDPYAPWQRGSNENTNGLLRQYFPKGTDLSVHAPERLAEVAAHPDADARNRVSVLLGNTATPQTLTVTHTLWAMLGVLPPGRVQRPHRHQSVALDLVVDCEPGCYSLVGDELDPSGAIVDPRRVDWQPGSAFVTPPGAWHSHHNESTTPAHLLPVQDAGLHTYLRSLDIRFGPSST